MNGRSCTRWREQSLLNRVSYWIDREWPHTGWIVALFLTVALAVGVSA